jgi:CheY-like chemotaxis protein
MAEIKRESESTGSQKVSQESGAIQAHRAFLANLRHELRTPLNAVIGYSEMLLENAADEGQEDSIPALQKIHAAGQELLALVNDVIAPAKIAAGELEIDLETLGANLRHRLLTPVNAVTSYSEMLLEHAEDLGRKDFVPDLQKIHSAAERFLALVNDIISFKAADSGLQSVNDTSATAQDAADPPSAATVHPLEDKVSAAPAKRGFVLVVDDNEMNRDLLSCYLEDLGLTVALAENGRQALEMVKKYSFDLVLLDIMMPEMDGYQVLQRLKSDVTWRDIPVIMVSALDEMDSVVRCIEMGAEDYLPKPFDPILLEARTNACLEKKRFRDQEVEYLSRIKREKERSEKLLKIVIPIGVALSAEKDFNRLLETMLLEARSLCNADGGTLYLRTEGDQLKFVIMRNDSLNIALGGTTGKVISFAPLPLYDETTGEPNQRNVATYAALSGTPINIADVYQVEGFDFYGAREFDKETGYCSKSLLTIPLKNNVNQVIGVLQLLNAQDPETGESIPFDEYLQQLIESLSSLAAAALEVYIREQSLRQQIEQLRIEIDQVKQARQVAEITETDYFRRLQAEAHNLRDILEGPSE